MRGGLTTRLSLCYLGNQMEDLMYRVDEGEPDDSPVRTWAPTWFVTVDGSDVGIAMDDGCVVFLAEQQPRQWMPLKHVPAPAIRFVADLLARPT